LIFEEERNLGSGKDKRKEGVIQSVIIIIYIAKIKHSSPSGYIDPKRSSVRNV